MNATVVTDTNSGCQMNDNPLACNVLTILLRDEPAIDDSYFISVTHPIFKCWCLNPLILFPARRCFKQVTWFDSRIVYRLIITSYLNPGFASFIQHFMMCLYCHLYSVERTLLLILLFLCA